MDDDRRLSFGDDAEQYDRARPSYPAAAVDAVIDGANIRRVLDVGCGTGIASQLFLDRGCEVVGVEPDERMAAVAHRRGVNVVVAPFETWTAPADPFDLVVSAQAWHWVDQNIGPTAAADALRPGGRLALLSNGYEEVSLRDELDAVYRQHAPQIVAKTFVLGRPALNARVGARWSDRGVRTLWSRRGAVVPVGAHRKPRSPYFHAVRQGIPVTTSVIGAAATRGSAAAAASAPR